MTFWLAREKSGLLYLHEKKPTLDGRYWLSDGFWANLDFEYFPEVTFENSPQEVEFVIKK